MTDRQIKAAKETLPGLCAYPWEKWTEEQKQLSRELDCREMINSCLCYDSIESFWRVDPWRWGEYKSYSGRYVAELGLARVRELCEEQMQDFSKAKVLRNVYTDSEGCTYNSIIWGDELR